MTTETPRSPRTHRQSTGNLPPVSWPRLRWGAVLVALLALCMAALWLWSHGSERRALLAMDPAQRRVLFEETRAGYRTMCASPGVEGLALRCRNQAEFLRDFPECDGACQAELLPSLNLPTR